MPTRRQRVHPPRRARAPPCRLQPAPQRVVPFRDVRRRAQAEAQPGGEPERALGVGSVGTVWGVVAALGAGTGTRARAMFAFTLVHALTAFFVSIGERREGRPPGERPHSPHIGVHVDRLHADDAVADRVRGRFGVRDG
jgi:hypothetical protein